VFFILSCPPSSKKIKEKAWKKSQRIPKPQILPGGSL
jgi:hypothetical protein